MAAVDLDADLVPGISGAGLRLGVRLSECDSLLRGATETPYRSGIRLNDAIRRNEGVLVIRDYFPLGSGNTAVFFGADVVRLDFNGAGVLFCIWAFEGYRGKAFGRIGIGSTLEEVRTLFPVFYDSGDEMYYPDTETSPDAPTGIAFLAIQEELPGNAPVLGMSIHDWGLMRLPAEGTS